MASTPAFNEENTKPDLWREAFAILSAVNQKQYEDCSTNMLEVLKQVRNHLLVPRELYLLTFDCLKKVQEATESKKQECVSKGWKLYRNKQGDEVKLRHVLEKLSVWVKGVINVIDIGVSFDKSGHAALP